MKRVLLFFAALLGVGGLAAPAPSALGDLPLTEVPAKVKADAEAPLMVMMTGDGGWAEFVRTISERLADTGWSVVGLDMRKYLWKARTPDEAAATVAEIVQHYGDEWHRRRVVIAGFSRGADLAPFVVNRLPLELRSRLALVLLLSPGRQAEFEFHFGDFIRPARPQAQQPVAEEVNRMNNVPLLMLYGNKDKEAIEVPLNMPPGRAIRLPGDHHLDRDYDTIVKLILAAVTPKAEATAAAAARP